MIRALAFALALLACPAAAVEPSEVLEDPALEARARALSKELRCLVCQNESIDDSNAQLARDLRILVRERLTEGDSDQQVITYLTDRYGEFVLLRPRFSGATMILWLSGPILFLLAAFAALRFVRSRGTRPETTPLSAEEEAALASLLKD